MHGRIAYNLEKSWDWHQSPGSLSPIQKQDYCMSCLACQAVPAVQPSSYLGYLNQVPSLLLPPILHWLPFSLSSFHGGFGRAGWKQVTFIPLPWGQHQPPQWATWICAHYIVWAGTSPPYSPNWDCMAWGLDVPNGPIHTPPSPRSSSPPRTPSPCLSLAQISPWASQTQLVPEQIALGMLQLCRAYATDPALRTDGVKLSNKENSTFW